MGPFSLLLAFYIGAAILCPLVRRNPLLGLGGAACATISLILAFSVPVDIETIAMGALGLIICFLLPEGRGRA